MAIIYKFKGKAKQKKSDNFIKQVDPTQVSVYLQSTNPDMPKPVADALSMAIITTTHLDLVLAEHDLELLRTFTDAYNTFQDIDYGQKTLH